jgi:hypothetical protein
MNQIARHETSEKRNQPNDEQNHKNRPQHSSSPFSTNRNPRTLNNWLGSNAYAIFPELQIFKKRLHFGPLSPLPPISLDSGFDLN